MRMLVQYCHMAWWQCHGFHSNTLADGMCGVMSNKSLHLEMSLTGLLPIPIVIAEVHMT